jgi:predicted phage terminase large subunit-like protein
MFDVYLRRSVEGGKVIFPGKFKLDGPDDNEKGLKSLEGLKASKGPYEFSCTPAETPILMADFSVKPISQIRVGDTVLGWEKKGKKPENYLAQSTVVSVMQKRGVVNNVEMASGRIIRCTPDHLWFSGRDDKSHRPFYEIKKGRTLQHVIDPVALECPTHLKQKAFWLGGIFDGEGSCSLTHSVICIAQSETHNPEVSKAIRDTLSELGFDYGWIPSAHQYWIRGGLKEKIRFLRWCLPVRGFKIEAQIYAQGARFTEPDKIKAIEPGVEEDVYALTTSTGNYVAWGYASKNCQQMNDPTDEETIEFKRHWLRTYDIALPAVQTDLASASSCLLSVDPAFRLDQTNDFSGLVLTKTGPSNTVYVLEALKAKMNAKGLIGEIFKLVDIYNPSRVLIEAVAAQIVLVELLRDEMAKRNKYFIIEEVKTSTKETKVMRIRGLIPHYANGRVLHAPGLSDLETELIEFPRGAHDDLIDALSYQVPYWKGYQSTPVQKTPYGTMKWLESTLPNGSGSATANMFKEFIRPRRRF